MVQQAEAATFLLPEVLDLKASAPLAQALLARRGADLQLDGSGVARLGAQCLQVLLSAHASWTADGHVLAIAAPSADLLSTLALLGVGQDSPMLKPE